MMLAIAALLVWWRRKGQADSQSTDGEPA